MGDKIKLLICGDVEGKFNLLFDKINTTNKRAGPFDLLLCIGNFFGVNNTEFDVYRNGSQKIPIPTYILGPNKDEHVALYPTEESDMCENLYYLGKRGIYTISGGLKIAYLSGILANDKDKIGSFNYTTDDALSLRDIILRNNPGFKGIDILLTSQWPEGVTNHTKSELRRINNASAHSAWLACQLKPRYHISGLEGMYYERPPYRNITNNDFGIVTRFIGLARVGNPKKEKWIYAVNLMPLEKMKVVELLQKTTDETDCPYDVANLDAQISGRKRVSGSHQQFFYDMSAPSEENQYRNRTKRQKIEFDQNKCWFCLASPSVEKHLVVTVGSTVYLAAAKGGLTPEHFLICPIEHHQSTVTLPSAVLEEIREFKEALRKFYARNGNVAVFFERNYKTSHMQIQAVPVPKQAADDLYDLFIEEAQGHSFDLIKLEFDQRLDEVVNPKSPYFALELPTGETLYTIVRPNKGFQINFAREVLALGSVLNMPDKIAWQDCVLPKDEETAMINRVRRDFQPFDITDE